MTRLCPLALFLCSAAFAAPVWEIGGVTYEARIGSLHSHTGLTDGTGSPAEAFEHARDIAGMDWWGVSDHIFSPDNARRTLSEGNWDELQRAADEFNEPGRFVTFPSYEWTVGAEHVVVVGVNSLVGSKEIEVLADETLKAGGLLNYSHIWLGAVPYMFNERHPTFICELDEVMGVADVFAVPGYRSAYEELIGAGYHVGAFAGQDNHDDDWGETGSQFGWAVAWTTNLDRESLMDAFHSGRTYATRVRGLVLQFSSGDLMMGQTTLEQPRHARLLVEGVPEVVMVELMRDGVQIDTWTFTTNGDLDFMVPLPADDPGRHAFHVRLWGDLQSMPIAVSSPIWTGVPESVGLVLH